MLWKYDFNGRFDGFTCHRITRKGKPPIHEIHYRGGFLIERKDYHPKWAKDVDKQFISMDYTIMNHSTTTIN